MKKSEPNLRLVNAFLLLVIVLTVSSVVDSSDTISQSLSSKITQVIQKINSIKKVGTDAAVAASSDAEAREPSSGYGHGHGHGGGGGGYGYGGGHGHGGGGHGGGGGGGGYGKGYGGGGGHGSGGHGAITLDPVSIISLLALGAFLINNILQLLRANSMMMSGRSLDVSDINVPLELSDIADQTRELREDASEPSFSQFFKNVGSLYYLSPKKRNICIKRVVCTYVGAQRRDEQAQGSFKNKMFDIMLTTITTLVAPEINQEGDNGKQCLKFNKLCSDSLLQDAKNTAESKVYGHVSSLVSKFALSSLMSG